MWKIIGYTRRYVLIRLILYLLSGAILGCLIWFVWNIGITLATQLNLLLGYLIRPMLIILSIPGGIVIHRSLINLLLYLTKLRHTIAATMIIMGWPKDTLFKDAGTQANQQFISLTSNSLVSRKALKSLASLKDAIMSKDIMPNFIDVKNGFLKRVIKYVLADIKSLLDLVDEILISYTWLATYLYNEYSEDSEETKKKVTKKVQRQAGFMLEGVGFFIKALPKLIISNIAYGFLLKVINAGLTVLIFCITWIITGFTWEMLLIVFFSHRVLSQLIDEVIIFSFRLCVTLNAFYTEVGKMESLVPEEISSLLQKIPALIGIAKKTGKDEYSGMEVPDGAEGSGGVVDVSCLNDAIRSHVNDIAKAFMVKERDILKDKTEVSGTETDTGDSEETASTTEPTEASAEPTEVPEDTPVNSEPDFSDMPPIPEPTVPESTTRVPNYDDLFKRRQVK